MVRVFVRGVIWERWRHGWDAWYSGHVLFNYAFLKQTTQVDKITLIDNIEVIFDLKALHD